MADHDASHAIYQPLNEYWEIRLLRILPASPAHDGVVHCELSVCSLEDNINYSALSYVWGDPNTTRPVIVNGLEVQATTNLADALTQLRTNGVNTLWVDALCINQANDTEKGHQVRIMDTIYREAHTVLAWLGPASSESKRALDAIEELALIASSAGLRNVLSPRVGDVPRHQKGKVLDAICAPLLSESCSLAEGDIGRVIALLERPYWRRLWILQEISLARSAMLLCGCDSVAWEKAEKALAVIKWLRHVAAQVPDRFEEVKQRLYALYSPYVLETWRPPPAAELSAHASNETRLSLFDLLDLTAYGTELECSDPRDRIYGLLGLVDENYPFPRTVGYSASYVDLFVQASLSMLSCHGAIILVYAGLDAQIARPRDESCEPRLPSWVVDWRCTQTRAQRLWEFVPDAVQEFVYKTSDDGFTLSIPAAYAAEVFAVVPYSLDLDLRHVFQQLKQARDNLFRERPECKDSSTHPLEIMLWHVLLYTASITPCGEEEITRLFNDYLHPESPQDSPQRLLHDHLPHDHHPHEQIPNPNTDMHAQRTFQTLLWNHTPRTLFLTTSGIVGSGPVGTRVGDVVHAVPGLEVPLLLRGSSPQKRLFRGSALNSERSDTDTDSSWGLVGAAYVDDMMEINESGFWTLDKFWHGGGREREREVREVVLI